jgi:hypothetical protein
MANAFGTGAVAVNPIVVDTAWAVGAIPAALTAIAPGGPQWFRRIVWTGATAAGTLVVADINSNVLFTEICPVTGQDIVLWQNDASPYKMKQSNWAVTTISSGKLLFYK